MNTQTLNRMIKASYYAPNGAQLRKACYGLLSVNSRRASSQYMSMEQIAQMPEEVQSEVIKESLIESYKKDREALSRHGLKDVQVFLSSNNISTEELADRVMNPNPAYQKEIESKVNTKEDAIEIASTVVKAKTYQEIFSFLDIPIERVQKRIEDVEWIRMDVLAATFATTIEKLIKNKDQSLGITILIMLFAKAVAIGIVALLEYLLGDFFKWLSKKQGIIMGYLVTAIPRLISLILKGFGSSLDYLKSYWKKDLYKQAKIAMQSPEFRRAYYN
jgi:hypothetical protein